MKLLLDTHVFLWFISGDRRLDVKYAETIRDSTNTVYLSVVSVWEAAVKHAIGRLPLPADPTVYLPTQRVRHGIMSLPLDESSVAGIPNLPSLHRDPFDRMLVCQARHHDLTLITFDKLIGSYPVKTL
jgi:PIN domain nuclease of toxin-antitoxin system